MNAADLLLEHGRILTLDPAQPWAEAVAVRAGRILAVGATAALRDLAGRGTRRINCGGGTVLPGFHDPHLHVLGHAGSLLGVDCGPPGVRSLADLQARIRAAAARTPLGGWIRAWGYHEFFLAEGRHPTRWDLDAAAPHHPVRLLHRTGHACVLNSPALRLAGIHLETPEPTGGVIERDLETGEPNGVLFEMGAYLNARNVPPPLSPAELERGVRLANQVYLGHGITTVHDATAHNGLADWATFQDLSGRGLLEPRLTLMVGADQIGDFLERGMISGWGDDRLRVGAVKLVLDESTGALHPHPEVLRELVLLAHQTGFQVAIHAIEARHVAAAVEAIAAAQAAEPRPDPRHRIEHASVCPPWLVERVREHGLVVVTQPAFIYHHGERYLAQVPPEDLPWLYRLRGLVEAGVPLALSSDAPVVPPDPLRTLAAAVTRQTAAGPVVGPQERLTLEHAVRAATLGAAYADFREDRLGRVVPGYLADLVVLDRDITASPALEAAQVRLTLLGGRVVWEGA
ncbi:MAG: amidohydrolase [Chloroflexi bacterium]|nr:amidohydrolase [Chloroflexota bacterium]